MSDTTFDFTVLCRGKASFIFEPDALAFEDADAAREHALSIIADIVGQDFLTPHDWRFWEVEVRGSDGQRFLVPFADGCGGSLTALVFRVHPSVLAGG
jgi:hypothetical protein